MGQPLVLNLTKGEKVDLTKTNPGLKTVHVGCGWDASAAGAAADIDAFALLVWDQKTQKTVFFNNKTEKGVEHMGDNLTGAGDGDDETIKINLEQLAPEVEEIVIGANLFQARERGNQNFGQVKKAFIRVYDPSNNQELIKFDLNEDQSTSSGMLLGKLYRKDGEWKFQALAITSNGDINQIASAYRP